MKSGPVLVATLFALTSFPVLAQQSPSEPGASPAPQSMQPGQTAPPDTAAPTATPQAAPGNQTAPDPTATPQNSAADATPAAEMRPVNAELVSKLDTKTAKTGDNVVAETKGSVKTADGTEIPKGSKLVGHVVAVQPSAAGQNSQVVLAFNQAELKGGQKLPIESQIQSIEPPAGEASAGATDSMSRNAGGASPAASNSAPGSAGGAPSAPAPGYASAPSPSAQAQSDPPAGTVVAKTGKIDIRATSIPGVLLANNQPGERDPRMAQASSILLGARQDVKLENGTRLVIGVAAAPGASPAAPQQ